MEKKKFTRRLFCKGIVITTFLPIASITGVIGCATMPVYHGTLIKGRITVLREELGLRFLDSKAIVVQVPELEYPIFIVQNVGDNYHALSVRCTHQGCHVRPKGEALACPCHGSTYDLEGNVIRGPAKAPLKRFDVMVTANGIDVIVNLNKNN